MHLSLSHQLILMKLLFPKMSNSSLTDPYYCVAQSPTEFMHITYGLVILVP